MLAGMHDAVNSVPHLFDAAGSLLAQAAPDFWPFSQDMWRDTTQSIDETLGAASQSSVDRLATRVDSLIAIASIYIVVSGFAFWKVNNDLTPIANEFRRQLLAQASTEVDVSGPEMVVTLTAPTSLPGLAEGSVSLARHGQRLLVVSYNLNGVTYDWDLELPAGKVFGDDSNPRHTFEPPSESKDSPYKSCRFIVKKPMVIDDPSYNARRGAPVRSIMRAGMPWGK